MRFGKCRKAYIAISLSLLFITILFSAASPPAVASPVTLHLNPTEGFVGSSVSVDGQLDVEGPYRILWDGTIVKNGTATGGSPRVSDSFTVPVAPVGFHNVTLFDVNAGNTSIPVAFRVVTFFGLTITPKRVQEGDSVNLNINVTGGISSKRYLFSVEVSPPKGTKYTANIELNTDSLGSGTSALTYPDNFSGGATKLVGIYNVNVNSTLIVGNFTVGITDKFTYRRMETAQIKAVGYMASETVTVDIKYYAVSVKGFPHTLNATTDGVVTDSWLIAINQTLGRYVASVTSASTNGTAKLVGDSQEFEVTHATYNVTVHVLDLAEKPLADITVNAYNVTSNSLVKAALSNSTGLCILAVDAWNYTFRALYNNVAVGELQNVTVLNTTDITLRTNMSNIQVKVLTEDGFSLPLVQATLTFNYTTVDNQTYPGSWQFFTNASGVADIDRVYPHLNYTLKLRRYNILFQTTNMTNLPLQPWTNLTVTCPSYNLNLEVLDSQRKPLAGANVNLTDVGSGILVSQGRTGDAGELTLRQTLGSYELEVYGYQVEIGRTLTYNITAVYLKEDGQKLQVICTTYNIDAYIRVVDYFGQPVSNVAVTMIYGGATLERATDSRGMVTLPKVGGQYMISVYAAGKLLTVESKNITKPGEYLIKINNTAMLAGYPVELIQLVSLIAVLVTLLLLSAVLLYRGMLSRRTRGEAATGKDLITPTTVNK